MRCLRCLQDIETDAPDGTEICGSCEKAEFMKMMSQYRAEAEAMAYQLDKEAYEDAQHDAHLDTGNGYQYG